MIPFQDENPSRTIPIINTLLIIANISAFIYLTYFVPAGASHPSIMNLSFIPYEWSHFTDIHAKNMVPVPLTVFTSMFIHGGWIHLLSNMLYLWIFGDNIEDTLGHFKYLIFYLLCGIVATLAHGIININSQIPTVGASGAIAGVLGAYLILFPKARIKTLFIIVIFVKVIRIPAFVILIYWISLQLLSAYAEFGQGMSNVGGGIAWFAHIGGFFAGLILVMVMKKRKRRSRLKAL